MQLPIRYTTLIICLVAPFLSQAQAAARDPLSNGPNYSQDKFPPYPPLTNLDGSNITVENLRGTRLYGWKGCGVSESKAIAAAFDDFYKLAKPLSSKIDWAGEIAEDFWGKNEGVNKVPSTRRTQIQQIYKAQQQMYAIGWHWYPPYWRSLWIEVRCSGGDDTGDPDNHCKDRTPNDGQCGVGGAPIDEGDNTVEAITEPTSRNPKLTYSRITFCNRFFNLPSLSEAMTNTPKKPATQRQKLDAWDNRARVFLHKTTHLDWFMNAPGSSPLVDDLKFDWKEKGREVRDWAYGPFFCKMLRNYGLRDMVAYYPQRNADSYAWFAMGSYVKQVTGTYPRSPRPSIYPISDPFNGDDGDVSEADAAPTQGQPIEDLVAASTEELPAYAEGFSTPNCPDIGMLTNSANSGVTGSSPNVALPPVKDNNSCRGIGGDYWVMSRDVAVENAKDFCRQSKKAKKYNVGSVNELELFARNLKEDQQGPKDDPECIGRLQNAVIDGCDGADSLNNPHNYKFGSTLTTADGWEYKMAPLSKQINEVNCDVSYKFWYDSFEIRGKNLPDAKLGANGEGLEKELAGCGALTKWSFERTPEDCCFQWYATGQLPVGTKSCIGRALMLAGGSGKGNCRIGGPSIDSWPGYGDDSRHVFNHQREAPDKNNNIWIDHGDEDEEGYALESGGTRGDRGSRVYREKRERQRP